MNAFSHYRIEAPLGTGGMGAVYRAFDTRLERTVALKFPNNDAAATSLNGTGLLRSRADEIARARLLNEARLASALNHPNICTVYEVGEADGQVYIAMEHVAGQPLNKAIAAGGLPAGSVVRYGVQIADALAHAHQRGVMHRDLKSSNVIVTPEGCAKVLDFGLAGRVEPERLEEVTCSRLSLPGGNAIAGTLPYLAPEVLLGERAGTRSDLWAFGVLLYEMATGELPFQGRTAFELTAAILREPLPSSAAELPEGLSVVICRCLAKQAAERYSHAAEVRDALAAVSCSSATGPARQPRDEGSMLWGERASSKTGRGRSFRILVVEDEPDIAFGLEADLNLEGYEVEVERDGARALERARKQSFDLILLDVMLPGTDGLEVCRGLRRGGSETPIILLTAKAQEADKVVGLELGADDYVTKPFSPRELRARIKAALRRARARD